MRISVTELDNYRYYRDHEEAELEKLLADLRKQSPPTRPMMAGTAWHKALERMDWGADETDTVEQDGFTFVIKGDIVVDLPVVSELKGEIELSTPSGPVTLVGVIDGFDATGIRDYKLTSQFDAERYTDAYQWRCYLLMFGARTFVYHLFVATDSASGDFVIREYHQMPFYAYPNLEADIQREVEEFAAFIATYLPERLGTPQLAGVA